MGAFGMRPVSYGSYLYNTGGFEEFKIADNTATSIYTGDLVLLTNDGVITRYLDSTNSAGGPSPGTGDPTAPALGVFVGCRYTDTAGTPQWNQYYPGGAGTDAAGFVVTDYNAVFAMKSGVAWTDRS